MQPSEATFTVSHHLRAEPAPGSDVQLSALWAALFAVVTLSVFGIAWPYAEASTLLAGQSLRAGGAAPIFSAISTPAPLPIPQAPQPDDLGDHGKAVVPAAPMGGLAFAAGARLRSRLNRGTHPGGAAEAADCVASLPALVSSRFDPESARTPGTRDARLVSARGPPSAGRTYPRSLLPFHRAARRSTALAATLAQSHRSKNRLLNPGVMADTRSNPNGASIPAHGDDGRALRRFPFRSGGATRRGTTQGEAR